MAGNNAAPQGFNKLIGKRLYLATYSQADVVRFPTRKSFGEYIVGKFNAGTGKVKVLHYVVCKEPHEKEGVHYHCAFKMSGVKKWYQPWKAMYNEGVTVSFSDSHDYYVSAYNYCTKMDEYFYTSENHPDLKEIGSPRTKVCIQTNRRKSQENAVKGSDKSGAKRSLENAVEGNDKVPKQVNKKIRDVDVGDFLVKKNIKNKDQLYAEAGKRYKEGECDLTMFIYSHTEKYLLELIKIPAPRYPKN